MVCVNCGHVEEFYDEEIERRQKKIAKERGFAIQEHALYLFAECAKTACPHRADLPCTTDEKPTVVQAKKSSLPPS